MRATAIALAAGLMASAAAAQMPVKIDPAPVDYRVDRAWICRPGVDDGSCSTNLDAMAVDAAGMRTPHPYERAKAPPIDCFYIYPTGSDDKTFYSDMAVDRSETRIVHSQAARLGEHCRLFAPAYHQITSAALGWYNREQAAGRATGEISFDVPYRDVLAAWRDYLARDNHGRGVVVIGHSQGAILLKRLIAEQIDGKPVQKRLVGAYLAGNLDLTASSFASIRPCRTIGATGCVVAWSSYADADNSARRVFGGGGKDALCVNPAALGGGRGLLDVYLPRPAIAPESDPPYVEARGQISAECVSDGQGNVLRIRIEPGRYADLLGVALRPSAPGWGLHPLDIALTQGNVVALIGAQAAMWRK